MLEFRDEAVGGDNPRWQDMSTDDFSKGKRVVVFSLTGAFNPINVTYRKLHGFENNAQLFYDKGIDEIYCIQ